MVNFIVKKLPYELSSHSGLALLGKYPKQINLPALLDPRFPVRSGVSNSAILKSLRIPANVAADSGDCDRWRCCAFRF